MNFTRQRYYCAEPETQDLVMGLRDIPFQVAIKEVSQDPLFEKYAMEVLKNFPMCSYQSYFDSTCYDEFLKVLQRLSAEDWIKIGVY